MSNLSTHVLDTALGRPAAGLPVRLEIEADGGWREVAKGSPQPLDKRKLEASLGGSRNPGRKQIFSACCFSSRSIPSL